MADKVLNPSNNNNLALSTGTLFLITNASSDSRITGFENGSIGRYIIVINSTNVNTISFATESSNSSPNNRLFLASSPITLRANCSITFIYATTTNGNRWVLLGNT